MYHIIFTTSQRSGFTNFRHGVGFINPENRQIERQQLPTLTRIGLSVTFSNAHCHVKNKGQLVCRGTLINNLYHLDVYSPLNSKGKDFHEQATVAVDLSIWHKRFAHVDPATILSMNANDSAIGLNLKKQDFSCTACIYGKGHRQQIPKVRSTKSTSILELIHSDVNGPIEVSSLGGSKYFITFIDDYSKWITTYTMKTKSESLNCFKIFHKYAENQTGKRMKQVNFIQQTAPKIKSLRTDNGGEYISNNFKSYLQDHGISHQLTVPYTPQQNGVAERLNRTLIDLVRSMLADSGIEKRFWTEALATAVYVRNRVFTRALPTNKTPHHLWTRSPPDVSNLRVFGSKCWYVVPKKLLKKLDPRSQEAIMIGYSSCSKGWKLWDAINNKMVVSRDVTFDESCSRPSLESSHISGQGGEVEMPTYSYDVGSVSDDDGNQTIHDDIEMNIGQSHAADNTDDARYKQSANNENVSNEGNNSNEGVNEAYDTLDTDNQNNNVSAQGKVLKSGRVSKPPSQWWRAALITAIPDVPKSYREATAPPNIDFWKPGIDREHDCLMRNKTWTYVDKTNNMHVLPCKYVFKIKAGKPKVRMVICGSRQIYGVDFNETFAPVVKLTTVRTVLAVAASMDLECEQMDVVTAFLHGDLDENIYMTIPSGFEDPKLEGKVCKLLKALYGLKQAPRQWYSKVHNFFISLGFKSSPNDPCLYIRHNSSGIIIIALYVDDLLIVGSIHKEIINIKRELSKHFEMKDLGQVTSMLGIEVCRNRKERKIFLSQSQYASTVLQKYGMHSCNPVATPMEREYATYNNNADDSLAFNMPYREAIGSLMYLMIGSRPDIAFAVSKLAQKSENPNMNDWKAVKRLLRYIFGSKDNGILLDVVQWILPTWHEIFYLILFFMFLFLVIPAVMAVLQL